MRKNRKGQIHNEFRLLVLDDDEMITLALRSYFEGCGYTVDIEKQSAAGYRKKSVWITTTSCCWTF